MRNVWMGLVLAGTAGCSNGAVNFEHQSELEVNTRGVALLDDGLHGQAGMYGTTCRVNAADASIGEDYDFPSQTELVADGGAVFDEPAVLVLSEVGAHMTWPLRGYVDSSATDYALPGLVAGEIFDDGIVTTTDEGSVHWVVDGVAVSIVDIDAAPVGFSVARDGTAFVGTSGGVVVATQDGSVGTIADPADLLAWDESAAVLYTAAAGETWLSGVEADGTVRWTTELGGAVTSVEAMGPLASAAVMVERGAGTGELLTVDGFTGEISSSLTTPSAARDIEISGNGQTMALVLDSEVHFFKVRGAP